MSADTIIDVDTHVTEVPDLWSDRLPARLREIGIQRQTLAGLARSATEEWTGQFNPRLVNQTEFLPLYNAAY